VAGCSSGCMMLAGYLVAEGLAVLVGGAAVAAVVQVVEGFADIARFGGWVCVDSTLDAARVRHETFLVQPGSHCSRYESLGLHPGFPDAMGTARCEHLISS
jgi:hypothetical protein